MLSDFVTLIFPKFCAACGRAVLLKEDSICIKCRLHLPYTKYEKQLDNPVARQFWGQARIEGAMSLLEYHKKSKVQSLLHNLKYRGYTDAGTALGRMIGTALSEAPLFSSVDTIIPVPLHPKKLKLRGYNQSELLAGGISEVIHLPLCTTALIRTIHTSTQTKKSKFERWENVNHIFKVEKPDIIANKNILLVDDVITTGNTLLACARELLSVSGVHVYVSSLAFAVN